MVYSSCSIKWARWQLYTAVIYCECMPIITMDDDPVMHRASDLFYCLLQVLSPVYFYEFSPQKKYDGSSRSKLPELVRI